MDRQLFHRAARLRGQPDEDPLHALVFLVDDPFVGENLALLRQWAWSLSTLTFDRLGQLVAGKDDPALDGAPVLVVVGDGGNQVGVARHRRNSTKPPPACPGPELISPLAHRPGRSRSRRRRAMPGEIERASVSSSRDCDRPIARGRQVDHLGVVHQGVPRRLNLHRRGAAEYVRIAWIAIGEVGRHRRRRRT